MISKCAIGVSPLPRGSRAIPTKLVLKIKYRADGSYDRHKGRLVVQGFHQRLGKDYFGTFAPMANFTNVRLIISLAVYYGWGLFYADIPQAFLRSVCDAPIYI